MNNLAPPIEGDPGYAKPPTLHCEDEWFVKLPHSSGALHRMRICQLSTLTVLLQNLDLDQHYADRNRLWYEISALKWVELLRSKA